MKSDGPQRREHDELDRSPGGARLAARARPAHRAARSFPLEGPLRAAAVASRILAAAGRIDAVAERGLGGEIRSVLRADQVRVLADVAAFLQEAATAPEREARSFGRIVLPPRTGKTVIAAHVIAHSRLATTIIVPTKTLVAQTVELLASHLPGVPVGAFFGEAKQLVEDGVNVTTYAMLQRAWASGPLPVPLATSALVFVDEAHHAMSDDRAAMLREGFDARALRIGLTATPDYDEHRALCRYFPALIHEITLEEALALDLLAPLRLWVAEVDEDASTVRMIAGEYEPEPLGALMSTAPFARAVEVFRYLPTNAQLPCLIACTTRQQASDIASYLRSHRPEDAPEPALLLGETPFVERERILRDFEAGTLDTLIQVGVLVEGWSSLRCKLLIDLAPSTSRVRAMQKYFRVMTRDGETEARVYVLLPRRLPIFPVLPTDFFGASAQEYECGELVGQEPAEPSRRSRVVARDHATIEHVSLIARIVASRTLVAPELDAGRARDVRRVVRSSGQFDPEAPCGPLAFRQLRFEHPLFRGSGESLLRWLGYAPTRAAYERFLGRFFPDGAATMLLGARCDRVPADTPNARELESAWGQWFAQLREDDRAHDPEAFVERGEAVDLLARLLLELRPRERRIVAQHSGLFGEPERMGSEIAEEEGVSGGRIHQILGKCERRLRHAAARRPAEPDGVSRPTYFDLRARATTKTPPIPPLEEVGGGWHELGAPLLLLEGVAACREWMTTGASDAGLAGIAAEERWVEGGLEILRATWRTEAGSLVLELHRQADEGTARRRMTALVESQDVRQKVALRLWGDHRGFHWYGVQTSGRGDERGLAVARRRRADWLRVIDGRGRSVE